MTAGAISAENAENGRINSPTQSHHRRGDLAMIRYGIQRNRAAPTTSTPSDFSSSPSQRPIGWTEMPYSWSLTKPSSTGAGA